MSRPRLVLPLLASLTLLIASDAPARAAPKTCEDLVRTATDGRLEIKAREDALSALFYTEAYSLRPGGSYVSVSCVHLDRVFDAMAALYLDGTEDPALRLRAGDALVWAMRPPYGAQNLYPRGHIFHDRLLLFLSALASPDKAISERAHTILAESFERIPPALRASVEAALAERFITTLLDKTRRAWERREAAITLSLGRQNRILGPYYLHLAPVRRALAQVLGDLGEELGLRRSAAEGLLDAPELASPEERAAALELIARLLPSESERLLLEDIAGGLALYLARTTPFGKAPDSAVSLALARLLERPGPALYRVRYLALFGLLHASLRPCRLEDLQLPDPDQPKSYYSDYGDKDRWAVLYALRSHGDGKSHLPDLGPFFALSLASLLGGDPAYQVRWLAAKASALIADPPPELQAALESAAEKDENPKVREAAKLAKSRLSLASGASRLRGAIDSFGVRLKSDPINPP